MDFETRLLDDDLQMLASVVAKTPHRASLGTAEGWRQYLEFMPEKPPRLPLREYRSLTARQEELYNGKRLAYILGLTELTTPRLRGAHEAMWTQLLELAGPGSTARSGVILSGPAFMGKSCAITTWGRQVELAIRRAKNLDLPAERTALLPRVASRDGGTATFLPVVYATMAPSMGGTARNILSFYNSKLRPNHRAPIDRDFAAIARYVEECQTSVLLLDQIHRINHAARGSREVSEMIKEVQDSCPSTVIVGAGIGIKDLDILDDGYSEYDQLRLGQTGARLVIHDIEPYRIADDEGRAEWLEFLDAISNQLLLLNSRARDVTGMADYIHRRTGGVTGAVMQLLRTGAGLAILNGDERLTKSLLSRVQLSHSAERQAKQSPSERGAPRKAPRKRPKPDPLKATPAPIPYTSRALPSP